MALVALAGALSCGTEPTASESGVHERWHQPQTGYGHARPVVVGDLVYFGTGDGRVVARDVATGTVRWSTRVGVEAIEGANFVAREGVVAVALVHYTVGLDAATGRELWHYEAPLDTVDAGSHPAPGQVVRAHLDIDTDAVYIPAWGASVSSVDLHTGAPRWVWQSGRAPTDTAVAGIFRSGSMGVRVSGDTVFATVWHNLVETGALSESWLVALDRTTGRELWRVVLPTAGQAVSTSDAPVVADNLVIATAGSRGEAFAVDRITRQVVWQLVTPERRLTPSAGPEVYGGIAYLDGGDSHIYALRASDGTVLWRAPFRTQTMVDLLVTERRVIFSTGAYLYVLDRQTGQQLVEITQPRTDEPLFSSPAAYANGRVFVTLNGAAWSFDEP
ncbi:MAG TPA: PQQ-binding-like beta-propeller repeat protein [Gemmatimonadaceae bacterium]|nr:PQQ-binding-like beta-propeller repeat protein [Gemmatimonadaceae bacterium]